MSAPRARPAPRQQARRRRGQRAQDRAPAEGDGHDRDSPSPRPPARPHSAFAHDDRRGSPLSSLLVSAQLSRYPRWVTSPTPKRDRLAAVVRPVVAAAGYDLEELAVTPAGRRRLVRVVVDADCGISLDDVAEVSRAISAALDEQDGLVGSAPYVLEVSSPGVDRPLTEARHWRRSVGRLVSVPVRDGGTVSGRLVRADDAGVAIEVGGVERELGYDAIGKGRVRVEFSREEDDS